MAFQAISLAQAVFQPASRKQQLWLCQQMPMPSATSFLLLSNPSPYQAFRVAEPLLSGTLPAWTHISLPTMPTGQNHPNVTLLCPDPPAQQQLLQYIRMLFIDFSSTFNTVNSSKLSSKLADLGIKTSLCNLTPDFLTNRAKPFGLTATWPPPSYWAPPSHKVVCLAHFSVQGSNSIIKFAKGTTMVSLINNNYETTNFWTSQHRGLCKSNSNTLMCVFLH